MALITKLVVSPGPNEHVYCVNQLAQNGTNTILVNRIEEYTPGSYGIYAKDNPDTAIKIVNCAVIVHYNKPSLEPLSQTLPKSFGIDTHR